MNDFITGYQWGDDGSYIGTYQFPDNKDQVAVYLPPNTTLTPPPSVILAGYEAAINSDKVTWGIRLEDLGWMSVENLTDPGTV